MEVSSRLLVGDLVSPEASEIQKELKKGKNMKRGLWFAITTAPDSSNLLYIMSPREMNLKLYENIPLRVLGIAGSKKEAYGIIERLFQKGLEQSEIAGMKEFFDRY